MWHLAFLTYISSENGSLTCRLEIGLVFTRTNDRKQILVVLMSPDIEEKRNYRMFSLHSKTYNLPDSRK
jgi:hypothetical protein